MSNWSELVHDLLIGIVERIEKLEDFIVFGAVCKGWSKAGKKEHFKGLWLRQETPYLMLPIRNNENDNIRELYSLVEDEIVASVRVSNFKERKCHESLGWLLAIENDGRMCLLDPISSVEIPVPHQTTLPDYDTLALDEYVFVQKMVLSARPSETSDFILMIICGGLGHLAFWRPGDESWNLIEIREGLYTDVMYHDGHFYTIGCVGCAWVFTFEGHNHNPPEGHMIVRMVANAAIRNEITTNKMHYILKTSQSLFIISRDACGFNEEEERFFYITKKFQVYEVDMSDGTWKEINNIGSMSIFVGHNATFAVDSSRFYGKIKGNHIYFTDDGWESYHYQEIDDGGKDMGAYNMETGAIESFYSGEVLLSKVCLPVWITPSF